MLICIKDGHAALQALSMLVCPDPLRNGYYFLKNVNQRKLEMARIVRALALLPLCSVRPHTLVAQGLIH
jgi:hypothetical protein